MSDLTRRGFLGKSAAVLAAAPGLSPFVLRNLRAAPGQKVLRKAACIGVFPKELSVLERFEVARRAGYEGIEPNTLYTPPEVEEYKAASDKTGVKIHSIMNADHWKYPLSDPDHEVVKKCMDGIRTSMKNARDLGADVVLLVPGVVTPDVRYVEVYQRSQARIRELLPLAEQLKVTLAVENVGNRFLLSPLEFVRYVDEIDSPYLKAYFDIGNIVSTGFPQDWIRTIGNRLVRVHIKRFEPGTDYPKFDPADRRTQGIDWTAVRRALDEVGYAGWVSAEVKGGDETYVTEVSRRMDRFFAGENPA